MVSVLLDGLTMSYPEGTALESLSLRVDDGEAVVLLGPSGSGKTTVLRLVAGLEKPTSGDVLFDGSSVNSLEPNERNVAMVFQEHVLYPFLNVRGNVGFPLTTRKVSRREKTARVEAEARVFGLEHKLSHRPRTLSSGQKQLTQVAKAMVSSPDVFLIDEAFEHLDPDMRRTLRTELRLLQQGYGVTAIYATHDQEDAMVLGDRLVVMDRGQVRQSASPRDVYERPADTFVARFVGSPEMSMLAGVAERGGVRLGALWLRGPHRLPREVIVGVRAESWERREDGLEGTVTSVQYLGSLTLVAVETPAGPLVYRITADEVPSRGDPIRLRPTSYHLFHPDNGKALHHERT